MYPKILTILGGIMICIGHKTNISTLQYVSSMRLNIYQFCGRCCGPDKNLVIRLWKWLCKMWLKQWTLVATVSQFFLYSQIKMCTMNLMLSSHYIYAVISTHKNLILYLFSSFFWYFWSFHLLENKGLLVNQNTKNLL